MRTPIIAVIALFVAGCVSTPTGGRHAPPRPVEHHIRVFAHSGQTVSFDALIAACSKADAVFLGEIHLDTTTHELELAVLEALAERSGRRVVLGLEMFERNEQPALDAYLEGRIDEAEFRQRVTLWGNYATDYRPLIEAAKRRGLAVVASNTPLSVRRKLARGGPQPLAALTAAERALLPAAILPASAAYWDRFDRTVRGHGMTSKPRPPEERLYSTQNLWDNSMGASCADALDRWPGCLVVHVNGGFHSAFHDGTVAQLAARKPDARIVTIDMKVTSNLVDIVPGHDLARADFVVYCRRRGRGYSQGSYAVSVARELRYRVRLPDGASESNRVPLLIWVPADGTTAREAESYWTAALGEACAIVTIEPPYPHRGPDAQIDRAWFDPATFRKDMGAAQTAITRIYETVIAEQPVDAGQVVVAGEGSGAAMLVSTMLFTRTIDAPAVALAPEPARKIGELALVDTTTLAAKRLSVRVLATDDARPFWDREIRAWGGRGIRARVDPVSGDSIAAIEQAEVAIRDKLGLPPAQHADSGDTILLVDSDNPRGVAQARRLARGLGYGAVRAITTPRNCERVVTFQPEDRIWTLRPLAFRSAATLLGELPSGSRAAPAFDPATLGPNAFPRHPDDFGGTTLLVVPREASAAERRAWAAVVAKDPLRRHSRFLRLMLCYEADGPSLAETLEKIRASGRRNVLVVPAMFCAGEARMARLERAARPLASELELAWRAGLGAEPGLMLSR